MLEIVPELVFGAVMISLIVLCTKELVDGLKRFVERHQVDLLETPQQLIKLFGLELAHVLDKSHIYISPSFIANESSTDDLQVSIQDDGGFSITFWNQGDDRFHLHYSTEAWAALQLATRRAVLRDIANAYIRYRQRVDESLREEASS